MWRRRSGRRTVRPAIARRDPWASGRGGSTVRLGAFPVAVGVNVHLSLVIIGAVLLALAVLDVVIEVSTIKVSWRQDPKRWQRVTLALVGIFFIAAGFIQPILTSKNEPVYLQPLYRAQPADGCFSAEEQGGNLLFSGSPLVVEDLVACKYSADSTIRERSYVFDLPVYAQSRSIVEFKGVFGIDEAEGVRHNGAEALWTIYHAGQQLCSVQAAWKDPATCKMGESTPLVPGEPLVIRETLVRSGEPDGGDLYLGVARPRLLLR